MRAQPIRTDMDEHEKAEAEGKRREQPLVALHHRLVYGKLHVEGGGEHDELQHGRERQRLGERAPHAPHPPPEGGKAQTGALLLALETFGRGQLERDAGEVMPHLVEGEGADAQRRIVDRHLPGADLFEHHEMVHVPVQDAGELDGLELFRLQPQAAPGHAEALAHDEHVLERDAL
nr:hypothetical protein [Microvirga roseola]